MKDSRSFATAPCDGEEHCKKHITIKGQIITLSWLQNLVFKAAAVVSEHEDLLSLVCSIRSD